MLSLDLALTREQKNQRLKRLRSLFALYFGFVSDEQIAQALAYQQVRGQTPQVNSTSQAADVRQQFTDLRLGFNNQLAKEVFDIFVSGDQESLLAIEDPRAGARGSILARLVSLITPAGTATQTSAVTNLHRYIKLFYCGSFYNNVLQGNQQASDSGAFCGDLDKIGFSPEVSSAGSNINEQVLKNRVAALLMDHPIMAHNEKNSDLLSVFFNSFPSLEIARATPVLNIKMFSSRQVIQNDGTTNKLSALSLPKFLLGAQTIENNTANPSLLAIALANQVTASQPTGTETTPNTDQPFQYYSIAGMELFTSPQTLVNPDAARNESNFLAKPIDPFRPLASIKSFDVDVKSTGYGLIGTKQAHLSLVLHDRSRMGEFADFVKPDRYGSSFLEVEYGWSHPDDAYALNTEAGVNINNPFAELMNLTRVKEQYNIVNGSFDFDEVGQVNINLNLITRGASELTEISITGEQNDIRQQITAIQNLSRQIATLTDSVYRRNNRSGNEEHGDTERREIRGHQMLGAAGDAMNVLTLNQETITSFQQLERALQDRSTGGGPTVQQVTALRDSIRRLYGEASNYRNRTANSEAPTTRNPSGGAVGRLRQSINTKIRNALEKINKPKTASNVYSNDIFLRIIPDPQRNVLNHITTRHEGTKQNERENDQLLDVRHDDNVEKVISLGTLIMSFVAKPLAAIKQGDSFKFREVQVYFYSFNNKASRMSHCNIASFPIFTTFFAREYSKFRLENAARASSVSLSEFMNFIASTMIDDPMNPAYGISQLYKQDARAGESLAPASNQDVFDREMQRIMSSENVSRSPDFQMPQIVFELESVPYGANETVLKLHIYDRTSSARSPLRELLSLSTEDTLATVASIPANKDAEQANIDQQLQETQTGSGHTRRARVTASDLRKNWADCYQSILAEVADPNNPNQLIEIIQDPKTANPRPSEDVTPPKQFYRFKGGVKRLKQLVMRYTPHVIYGAMGTTVKSAKLASQQNSQLASMNMIRNTNSDPILATGEQPGGIPLQIYPVELSLTTLGCPFIRYSQELFVDFNTNTTADNIYYVTGLQHRIEQGNFETTIKLTACDAFPAYRNFIDQLNSAAVRYTEIVNQPNNGLAPGTAPGGTATSGTGTGTSGGASTGSQAHGRGSGAGHRRSSRTQQHPSAETASQRTTPDGPPAPPTNPSTSGNNSYLQDSGPIYQEQARGSGVLRDPSVPDPRGAREVIGQRADGTPIYG